MRWLSRALAGSLGVHAALLLVAGRWHPDDRTTVARDDDQDAPGVPGVIELSDPPPPPPPPIAIVPIDLVSLTTPIVAGKPAPSEPAATRPAIAAPHAAATAPRADAAARTATPGADREALTTGTTAPAADAHDDTGSRLLSMRDPYRRPDAAGTAGTLARIAEGGKPLEPPVTPSGRMAPSGGGTARIDDLTFTGRVEADGTVHIDDKPNAHVHVHIPKPKEVGKAIADWAEDPYAYTAKQQQPGDAIETAPRGDRARINPADQKPDSGGTVGIISGGFDLTAWVSQKVLGKAKGDVYAARKRAALDATMDERVEMRRRHRKDQLDHADGLVRDTLDRLWSSGLSIAEKKESLFELWDDCAETGEPAIVAAAARARQDVIGYVRAKLPPGAADAFTPAELDALNAHRTSHQRFAPYDDAAP